MKQFLKNRQKMTLAILATLCLLFFRYDFTYNLLPYKVTTNDTFWNILESNVYHNAPITGLSLKYLQESYPKVDFHKVMKNVEGKGGYTISIFFNQLAIIEPKENKPIIKNALLLPPFALVNHAIMVIVHNMIVFAIAFFFYAALKDNEFRLNKAFFKNTFSLNALFAPLAGVVIFIAGVIALFIALMILMSFLSVGLSLLL